MNKIEMNNHIALNWIQAFNDHNLEALLSLYADDAIHFSPKLKIREPQSDGWIHGKPALRVWWEDAFARLPALQYQLKNIIVNNDKVLMEYLRKVPGEAEIMVAEILEIENGTIIKSRVYHG